MKSYYLISLFIFISFLIGNAQPSKFSSDIEVLGGYASSGNVPFWLRSNQFGSIPLDKASLSMIGSFHLASDHAKKRFLDWGASFEGRLNIGYKSTFTLIEGYGKLQAGIFEIKAGRVREITGLCDTILTSGSFSISGNALGVPKIQLSIPEFYTLPFLGKLFAFKGSYMHGWIGNWYINDEPVPNTPTYLHQKTLYGRFGKPSWKLKLFGGFNHQVIWGNEKNMMGSSYALNKFQTFLYVNTGKAYSHDSIQATRIGNHLGSIDLGLTYEFKNIHLLIYRQNFYDGGALYHLANLLDGLNGLSFVNKSNNGKGIRWSRLLLEFLYTKNQAGEKWSRNTPSPYEDYYNNGYYLPGWSYKGDGLGTPFISPSNSLKDRLPIDTNSFFANNRVAAIHLGIEGDIYGWNIISKFSYSKNYGIYLTSPTGKIYDGGNNPSSDNIFPETGQLSIFLETRKALTKGIMIGVQSALDLGKLYNNSFGLLFTVSKSF